MSLLLLLIISSVILGVRSSHAARETTCDLVVYGATPAGIGAAITARQKGKNVVLISPSAHVGGLTSNGLGFADVGEMRTVGGLCKEFYHRVWLHYQDPGAWKFEPRDKFKFIGQSNPGKDDVQQTMIIFEPHVAEKVFNDMLADNHVPIVRARLDLRPGGVDKQGARITGIRMEDGQQFHAAVFIDASYEGDLMAKAGVNYIVGRESNAQYGEKINGIEVRTNAGGGPGLAISPFQIAGRPESGLLPGINPDVGGPIGSADKRIQAYCYRLCLTDAPENRLMVEKPDGYREVDYELFLRALEAGQKDVIKISPMPNRKSDCNNAGFVSMDYVGMNYDYPDADYARREKIAKAHENWQRGLIWTIQNNPRVPQQIRQRYASWGLCRDEFPDNGHWSSELYIREGRRMIGELVESGKELEAHHAERSIGMASYRMDSHTVQRFVGADGCVHSEGDVSERVGAYPIDYGATVPKAAECENLLVPVCFSASHIAYGSMRMEPVFMVLGQSDGVAACLAVDAHSSVQAVSYPALREALLNDKQVLAVP